MDKIKSYLNFDLLLDNWEGGYRAILIDSPAGQAQHFFTLPFSDHELEKFIFSVAKNRGNVRSFDTDTTDAPDIEELGAALYDCVLGGEIGEFFRASRVITYRENKGLRIRLRLSNEPKLIDIPWEVLFDPTFRGYPQIFDELKFHTSSKPFFQTI